MSGLVRVLRVIARLNVGGPALQIGVLDEGLDATRFEQLIVAGSVGPGEADYVSLRAPDLRVRDLPGWGRDPRPLADVAALRELRGIIREFRPHIVHTHTAKAGTVGRLAAWSTRAPATVHTFHGHLLHGYFSPVKTAALVRTERTLARHTTRLVAVGSQVRDELVAAGVGHRDQYVVVPPGVRLPPAPSREAARAQLGLPVGGAVVVFVARLTAIKRPDRFVEVSEAVLHEHADATFVVVGEGELLEATRSQAEHLGGRVRFLGWRSDIEVVYAASDVVLLTSDNEGTPVSLIEAATCGRPAVTTRVGSAGEVVIDGETGYVTSCEVADLAAAVSALLTDPTKRAEMGAAAAAHARRNYGAHRLVTDTQDLYESIVDDG